MTVVASPLHFRFVRSTRAPGVSIVLDSSRLSLPVSRLPSFERELVFKHARRLRLGRRPSIWKGPP